MLIYVVQEFFSFLNKILNKNCFNITDSEMHTSITSFNILYHHLFEISHYIPRYYTVISFIQVVPSQEFLKHAPCTKEVCMYDDGLLANKEVSEQRLLNQLAWPFGTLISSTSFFTLRSV